MMAWDFARALLVWMVAGASAALACDPKAPAITDEAFLEHAEEFERAGSRLKALAFYSLMLRSRNVALLDEAIRMGLVSDFEGVKAAALQCILIRANSVTIKALPYAEAIVEYPALTDGATTHIEAGYSKTYPIYQRFPEKACVNIYPDPRSKACLSANHVASRDGGVSLIAGRPIRGQFHLEEDGLIRGEISIWNGGGYDSFPGALSFN